MTVEEAYNAMSEQDKAKAFDNWLEDYEAKGGREVLRSVQRRRGG